MQNAPLVTIICLSYNHASYVEKAIESILQQSYSNIETIIVDDASTDDSVNKINASLQKYNFKAKFIALSKNIGNCKAFNLALKEAKGEYILDLAADDIILKDRIKDDVECLEQKDASYGAVFSDVAQINPQGKLIKPSYYQRDQKGILQEEVIQGDVYLRILKNPPLFSAPGLTYKASTIKELGGYDERLAYEDFDVWVRMSRSYKFAFVDKVNTHKRILPKSHSQSFMKTTNNHLLKSTLIIGMKAQVLNKSKEENEALALSMGYHQRLAFFTENFYVSRAFYMLLKELVKPKLKDRLFYWLAHNEIKVNKWYKKFR